MKRCDKTHRRVATKLLRTLISQTKRKALIEVVDIDVWKLPYRIVMEKKRVAPPVVPQDMIREETVTVFLKKT